MPTCSWFLAAARTMAGPPMSMSSTEGSEENGYRFDTTRSMASIPLVARSSRCSGFDRSARMPPWILGCSVLTRPPSISGEPVTWATSRCAMPSLAQLGRRVSAGDQLPAQVREALGQLDQALLVVDGQQGSHDVISSTAPSLSLRVGMNTTSRLQLAQSPGHGGRVEPALDHLDALVQRLLGVAGEDRDHLLGQDRPGIHFEGGQVHGAARLGDTGGQGVTHPVPARERREQGGVGVQDPIGKGLVDGTRHDGAEARHGHQIDLVGHQRGRHRRS